ncbi:MAG TPA: TetR/AcrR family transcriptional regulator [Spirochaetota bacterium]|nr:TetR/AcrR family transcriptional regulator [Spirochaetota bacterium]HOD16047.1 TetR/AcrR family transcriptional regulator [Spirochaetota bacterium]HPG50126.1 TetR/AcrR family transcriptional regulator [Spirochaetota bacterium]HPN10926.1 TetR/AcrR family transcriptional regulator [Spirochaetota bacterium]HQL81519.1 TetR/AcrR family transcriptional regulator [Spirochaetota bacterium]
MKKPNSIHASTHGRKSDIIRAALACFTEKGFTGTSIEDVCSQSGASVGSLYHHFTSKELLASAVYLEGIRDYQTGLVAELEKHAQARDGVRAVVRFHLEWIENNPDWSRYLFQQRHAMFMADSEGAFARMNAGFMARLSAWFRMRIEAGGIRRLPADLYPAVLLGPCQEYARLYLEGSYTTPVKKAAEVLADAAWAALDPSSGSKGNGKK